MLPEQTQKKLKGCQQKAGEGKTRVRADFQCPANSAQAESGKSGLCPLFFGRYSSLGGTFPSSDLRPPKGLDVAAGGLSSAASALTPV